jgi:hypothetical protein
MIKSHAKINPGKVVILLTLVYTSDKKKTGRSRVLIFLSGALLLNNLTCQASVAAVGGSSDSNLVKEEPKTSSEVLSAEVEADSAKSSKSSSDRPFSDKQVPEATLMIDTIKVEGNRLVPTEDILQVVKTKPGDRFNRDTVMEDLKAINGLGYFDERNLQVVPELNGSGVLLKIRVTENAPITQFAFSGNKMLDSQEIAKVFTEQMGKVLY